MYVCKRVTLQKSLNNDIKLLTRANIFIAQIHVGIRFIECTQQIFGLVLPSTVYRVHTPVVGFGRTNRIKQLQESFAAHSLTPLYEVKPPHYKTITVNRPVVNAMIRWCSVTCVPISRDPRTYDINGPYLFITQWIKNSLHQVQQRNVWAGFAVLASPAFCDVTRQTA